MADHEEQGREALGLADSDQPELLSRWVDSLWTATCPHGGGYARDCTRCVHETLYRSDWLKAHDAEVAAATAERIALAIIAEAARDAVEAQRTQYASYAYRRDGLMDAARIARADESNPR